MCGKYTLIVDNFDRITGDIGVTEDTEEDEADGEESRSEKVTRCHESRNGCIVGIVSFLPQPRNDDVSEVQDNDHLNG